MKSNKRSEYASNSSGTHTSRGHQPTIHPGILDNSLNAELNTFFPFDPYKLPRSNSYIQGVYREWSSVALDDEDEDEDDDYDDDGSDDAVGNDEQAEEDVLHDGYLSIRPRDDDTGLGESLGAMSISPARPTLGMSFS
jgi:RNA polymerase I-specific transcription initiation factor RRN3